MKKLFWLSLLFSILVIAFSGCGDNSDSNNENNNNTHSVDAIVGEWYDDNGRCLDIREDGTYRLTYDYGIGTWKKIAGNSYEFYDFYGSVDDVTLEYDDSSDPYVKSGNTKFYKKSGLEEENSNGENNEIKIEGIDESFLTERTVSEGLQFSLSTDKTYYILTGIGTCKDKHIVIPEYPSEYNHLPLKRISCGFSGAEYITIPASVESISSLSSDLKAINYLGDFSGFCKIFREGYYYTTIWEGKIIYINGKALIGDINIPQEVKSISAGLFCGYDKITGVTFSSDVIIGNNAFYKCPQLKRVNFADNEIEIGVSAFSYCEKLETVITGNKIKSVGMQAFLNTQYYNNAANWDKGLLYIDKYLYDAKEDVINADVKEGTLGICDEAFCSNKNLTSVIFPKSLKWIGEAAFDECKEITTLKYWGTGDEWNQIVIGKENDTLTTLAGSILLSASNNIPIFIDILEYNGHKYAVFSNYSIYYGDSWDRAKAYCESIGGHLATLTSEEENNAVYEYIKSQGITKAYIGLSDSEEEGVWKWVTDEKFEYSNWNVNEPNGESNENYGAFWSNYSSYNAWRDVRGAYFEKTPFICEWDS